jgi:uncharacterized protein
VTRVERPSRPVAVPELFLGLLAIGVAVVLTAHIFSGTIHDVRHTNDTLSVTGSARVPISADLVRWTLTVGPEAATAAAAARLMQRQSALARKFLRDAGIPAEAISPSVVTSREIVIPLPHHRRRVRYRVEQQLEVTTHEIDVVEQTATGVGGLIERGIDVSAEPLEYISTELTRAKLTALEKATEEARRRAEILVHGLGGKLGRMRASSQGVYQVTPRDSTDVSDYGINDTSSRDKDVNAVVSATFAVKR